MGTRCAMCRVHAKFSSRHMCVPTTSVDTDGSQQGIGCSCSCHKLKQSHEWIPSAVASNNQKPEGRDPNRHGQQGGGGAGIPPLLVPGLQRISHLCAVQKLLPDGKRNNRSGASDGRPGCVPTGFLTSQHSIPLIFQ